MDDNKISSKQVYVPGPLPESEKPRPESSRRRPWRTFAILAGSLVGLIALVALTVVILAARGMFTGTPGHINEEPTWSPDGSKIAFTSDRSGNYDIYVMNSNGSNVRQLTSSPFATLSLVPGNADDYAPAWSPDGKQIAFVSGRNNLSWSFVDTDIYIMDQDGQNVVKWKGSQYYSADKFPEWSPDGCCITYASSPYPDVVGSGLSDIYMASTDPSLEPIITNLTMLEAINSDPSWSPDKNRIVFASVGDESWHIYMMNKNGSDFIQLTFGNGSQFSPAWSPDGTRIAYTGVIDGRADIYIMNADGTNIAQLTNGPANSFLPAWSPDSSRIAFVSEMGGEDNARNIFVMNADGSNVIQLTQ